MKFIIAALILATATSSAMSQVYVDPGEEGRRISEMKEQQRQIEDMQREVQMMQEQAARDRLMNEQEQHQREMLEIFRNYGERNRW